MENINTKTLEKLIKNYEAPHCEIDDEHKHHLCNEICLSRSCIGCFKPICYHCKFEGHMNNYNGGTPKTELTKIDVIPKFRNLANSSLTQLNQSTLSVKSSQISSKSKGDNEITHEVHPIKWVLTSLNQQIEQHLKMQGNNENDLWDQTEQDLQNVIEYSERLKNRIQELQEGAEALRERYIMLKRQSERDERIKLVSEIVTDLVSDNSIDNLQKQLKALRKYVFVERRGKITIMGEQEMLKLENEKKEMQDNIDKYVQICQATYSEVQECLVYAHEIIKSEQHGMSWFKKYSNDGSNSIGQNLINSSMVTVSKINSLTNNNHNNQSSSPLKQETVKSVLLRNSNMAQSDYSFTSENNSRFKKKPHAYY